MCIVLRLSLFALVVLSGFGNALAFEPIPITISHTMSEVIFDGRWTHETEWKASSLNTYDYDDGTQVILRSAHQDDFIYIFLNPTSDSFPDKQGDYAIICFDTKTNKSVTADIDDYCFMAVLEGASTVYLGGDVGNTNFKEIPHPEGFVGVSSISDHNDRYTPVLHPSYEFRIPTDLVGRESVYGFFFLVYDAHTDKAYTYPQYLSADNFVPSPSEWGEIYSPDKSLPEFGWPAIALLLSFGLIICLTRLKHMLVPVIAK